MKEINIHIKERTEDAYYKITGLIPVLDIKVNGRDIVEVLEFLGYEIVDMYREIKDTPSCKMRRYSKKQKELIAVFMNDLDV